MHDLAYTHGGVERLDEIRPLWEELNRMHAGLSSCFADRFRSRSFADRKAELVKKAQASAFRVDLALHEGTEQVLGYCVSTMDPAGVGEIESLFVDEQARRRGIGTRLMRSALAWMESAGAIEKRVLVASGNEAALAFYALFGFYSKHIQLMQVDPSRRPIASL